MLILATRTLIWTTVPLTNVMGLTLAARFELLKPADRALYRAKDRGRDRVEAA